MNTDEHEPDPCHPCSSVAKLYLKPSTEKNIQKETFRATALKPYNLME